jgi:DNA-binding MarR family transcriptional regulator
MQDEAIRKIRAFNRFYTNVTGILDGHILESPLSLSEARVLYELNHRPHPTARQIMQALNIDEGYLSRILHGFIRQGLLKKTRNESDRRSFVLTVTAKGKAQFMKINHASDEAVRDLVSHLREDELEAVVSMMESIEKFLSKKKYTGHDTE